MNKPPEEQHNIFLENFIKVTTERPDHLYGGVLIAESLYKVQDHAQKGITLYKNIIDTDDIAKSALLYAGLALGSLSVLMEIRKIIGSDNPRQAFIKSTPKLISGSLAILAGVSKVLNYSGLAAPLTILSNSVKILDNLYQCIKSVYSLTQNENPMLRKQALESLAKNSQMLLLNSINLLLAVAILTPVFPAPVIPILAIAAIILTIHMMFPMIKEKYFGKTISTLGSMRHSTLFRQCKVQMPKRNDRAFTDESTRQTCLSFSEPDQHQLSARTDLIPLGSWL